MSLVLCALNALLLAVTAALPDSTPERIVRRFEPVEVIGGRLHDPRSSQTVHLVTPEGLRVLPLRSLADAVALQNGVVAVGEDLHVRGGRAGELRWSLQGVDLNEPLRGRAIEMPLFAVQRAELLAGGLEADHGGSLAGVLDVQTIDPTATPHARLRWLSSGRRGGEYDQGSLALTGPLGVRGLGIAAAIDARLDDQGLPALRTRGRTRTLGRSFGWRNDNHLSAWTKLAPVGSQPAWSLEAIGSRVVRQPYDPMFTFDDSSRAYFAILPEIGSGDTTYTIDSVVVRYRAADHALMQEERSLGLVFSTGGSRANRAWRASAGWLRQRSLTSVGLRPDMGLVLPETRIRFGVFNDPRVSPFLAYSGDVPYLRRSLSQRWMMTGQMAWSLPRGNRLRVGGGLSEDEVRLLEVDDAAPEYHGVDTARVFHAFAPGGYAYAQHRWEQAGLVWNTGLRLQLSTAGPQAGHSGVPYSWSPRLGFSYPMSTRDAFSLSYVRLHQEPTRELLYDSRTYVYNRRPLGNEQLTPSEVISWQVGLKHRFEEHWALQASMFYRDLYGQIGVQNAPRNSGTYRPQYANATSGHAVGYEVALLAADRVRGECSLRYTFLNATGTLSSDDGWSYGPALGGRPVSVADHPLDWDLRHLLTFDLAWHRNRHFTFAWITQAASGAPWTPTTQVGTVAPGPSYTAGLDAVNSRRLPWSETSAFSVRWTHRWLHGAQAMLEVRNVFDGRAQQDVSVAGFPNPVINSAFDEYAGFRTDTGRGGGGYWNDPERDGTGRWIAIEDPRLFQRPRSLRIGAEWAL